MVDFARLQAAVKERLEEDRSVQAIEAEGESFELALDQAASLLDVPIRHLEYEILQKEISILGIGRNYCKIRAWERPEIKKSKEAKAALEFEELLDTEEEIIEEKNGEAFVQARHDGIYLKVISPIGRGEKVSATEALSLIEARSPISIDHNMIAQVVKKANGTYVNVAEYKHVALSDSTLEVEIGEQDMKAFIKVSAPGKGGADLRYEDYINALNSNDVTYGIMEDYLHNLADRPVFGEKLCVAVGKKPVDGLNSYVEYYFETDQNKVRLKETSDGKVNFKELNIIQNVFEGEKLAKVMPAQFGEMGFTVIGKSLPAKDGKDVVVTLGKNVHFGEDGLTILADINGQVVITNSKINVESVLTVEGSVNLKTGNIEFLGNVVVTGNVEEGFSVKASGNIEVYGTVDKASLNSEADIVVRQGITGKEGTKVTAGCSLWVKFIENADVYCGNMVVVSDGIINSTVDAAKRIICEGKRAAIIGGRLRAGEEICARSIGSPGGNTETICEVGVDPKSKAELDEITARRDILTAEFDDVQLNYQTLIGIKQQRKELPPEKEVYFDELVERRKVLVKEVAGINERIEQINRHLEELDMMGRVSASVKVYNGVVIIIRELKEVIRTEYKAVTFISENHLIRAEKYVDIKTDTSKKE
ncbi:MAG: FapA family protein [Termitinemataceae bacterium]|nr:MAG: FapA family protein [Termitinemataceae bacterium]